MKSKVEEIKSHHKSNTMRKVMYQLNSLSEPMPGFFHCWAGTMQDAYAVIEDTTTGKIHRCNDGDFRFMTPPESKDSKEDVLQKLVVELKFWNKLFSDVGIMDSENKNTASKWSQKLDELQKKQSK